MSWAKVNPGNEVVDPGNGGLTAANIMTGLHMSRQQAETTMPQGATVADIKETSATIEDLGGNANCFGVGWAWGSLLIKTTDDAVQELVYLYIGFCNNGDTEKFFYSDAPVQLCKPPKIPR